MVTTGRTGKLTTKADEIAGLRPSAPGGSSEKIADLKVHVYGHVAVTTFRIETTGSDDTGAYHRRARYREVWVHRDSRRQLVASHSSLMPE
jgi:ketosteroid isomerase-like protein